MPIIDKSAERLEYWHEGGRRTSISVALRWFLIAATVVGPGVLLYYGLQSPTALTFACERATGQCTYTHYRGGEPRTCPISQLRGFEVYRPSKRNAALVYRYRPQGSDRTQINYWSGEVSSAEDTARLQRAVADLRAFAEGTAPRISATVPNGDGGRLWWLLPLGLVVALWQLRIVLRSYRRSEVVIDQHVRTVTVTRRRYLWPPCVQTTPFDGHKHVLFLANVPSRFNPLFRFTLLGLVPTEGKVVFLVEAYWAKQAESEARELARELGRRLDLPVVES